MADRAQVARFRVWQIESGRVVASPEEEVALRRALLEVVKERSGAFLLHPVTGGNSNLTRKGPLAGGRKGKYRCRNPITFSPLK
jgi:hypothetical protein